MSENNDIYESHKLVKRTPMTRLEYNRYRNWELPSDEAGDDEGYLVEYLDGGTPNDKRHEGYISWSPKEQFDNGYTKVLEPHQQRAVAERKARNTELLLLNEFIANNHLFLTLDEEEKERLQYQARVMTQLVSILDSRIANF